MYTDLEPIHPVEVLRDAWKRTGVDGQQVQGSCTICIATVDPINAQLLYSNVGDCGLLICRHIDSEIAGYMR